MICKLNLFKLVNSNVLSIVKRMLFKTNIIKSIIIYVVIILMIPEIKYLKIFTHLLYKKGATSVVNLCSKIII